MGSSSRAFAPPSTQDFVARLMEALAADPNGWKNLVFDGKAFAIRSDAGTTALANIYAEHCRKPHGERKAHFRQIVAILKSTRDMPDDFDDAKPDLLPTLRHRSGIQFALWDEQSRGKNLVWPHQIIAEDLAASVVYDWREMMTFVVEKHLRNWNISFYETLELARQNLMERTETGFASIAPGVWQSPWRDNYDASRILISDFVRVHHVSGAPVAMIPNRDTVILTGAEDINGLRQAFSIVNSITECPRPISLIPIRLSEDDSWEPLSLAQDHPLYHDWRRLRFRQVVSDYADQQESLQRRVGEDVFVASCRLVEHDVTGEWKSYAVWAEGIETLLPLADTIYFRAEDGQTFGPFEWNDVLNSLGDLIEPVEHLHPLRFRVQGFPSTERFRGLMPS